MTGKKYLILIILIIFITGCENKYTPKPRGFFRISFPKKEYTEFNRDGYPYKFRIPVYAEIEAPVETKKEPYDITVSIPENKADIHISYKTINPENKEETLESLLEDSRALAYKHTIKADAIDERLFINDAGKVYGTIYLISGNAASPMQFYLTDSTRHFLRGSFYIRDIPDIDSLQPVIDFLEPDIIRMIETTTWK